MSEKEDTTTDAVSARDTKDVGDSGTTKEVKKKKKDDGSSAAPYPDMSLAQDIHRVLKFDTGGTCDTAAAQAVADKIAKELQNPALYQVFQKEWLAKYPNAATSVQFLSCEELRTMSEAHKEKMALLEKAVKDAKESAGDMEVMEGMMAIARFAAQSLTPQEAVDAYQKVLDLPKLISGKKMDCYMELARVTSFAQSLSALATAKNNTGKDIIITLSTVDDWIDKADKLAQSGSGDWDRRNRVSVYKALQCLLQRDLKKAADILIEGIATFTCVELCTYPQFLIYAALTNLLHLQRPQLYEKVIQGPELLAVAPDIPLVMNLIRSYYDCDYKLYLQAMVDVEQVLLQDRYLSAHAAYWMRELHLLAYKQFLDSYQSVTLQAMSEQFGVSVDFLDYHASQFIAAGRLSAKIDKFGGVIVTNRADWKNAQYRQIIQKGDALLNRIQKLARVVDV